MRSRYILLIGAIILNTIVVFGQEQSEGLKYSHTIKIHGNANPYETGATLSHQYYLGKRTGIQTNISFLFPIDDSYNTTDYAISGSGYRITPEFRFYPSRKHAHRTTSFFMGGGPILKSFQMREREWNQVFDKNTGTHYSQLSITKYDNLSYGMMAVIGIEGYFDKPKRFTFEASYSFGITSNRIKMTGDTAVGRNNFLFEDISVSNRNDGVLPYVDFRFGIGYRFGKNF